MQTPYLHQRHYRYFSSGRSARHMPLAIEYAQDIGFFLLFAVLGATTPMLLLASAVSISSSSIWLIGE